MPILVSKYGPSPLNQSYKSQSAGRRSGASGGGVRGKARAGEGGDSGVANATGPCPVCITLNRAGEERVQQTEETNSGLLVPLGLRQYLGGSVDKVRKSK